MSANFTHDIERYVPKNEQEDQDKKVVLRCIRLFPDNILLRTNELAHITSSAFVVNRDATKVLMIHHNIRNTWAWTGGHADGDGDLLAVAVRETLEEAGVTALPMSNEIDAIDILYVERHMKNGKYVNTHLHLNVAYVLVADEHAPLTVKPDENSAVKWFAAEDVEGAIYAKMLSRAREHVQKAVQ